MAKAEYRVTLDDGVTPLELQHNPVNILKYKTTYKENERYGTIFRRGSGTIRFSLEGRDYLIALKNAKGIDAECSIKIERLNKSTQGYGNPRYGIIDFEKWNNVSVKRYLDVNILDGSDIQKLFNRENLQINVTDSEDVDGNPITDPLGIFRTVNLPQIKPVYWAIGDGNIISSGFQQAGYSVTEYFNGQTSFNNIGSDFNDTTLVYTNNTGNTVSTEMVFTNLVSVLTGGINVTDITAPVLAQPGDFVSLTFILRILRIDTGAILDDFAFNINASYPNLNDLLGNHPFSFNSTVTGSLKAAIANSGSQGIKVTILTREFLNPVDPRLFVDADFTWNLDIQLEEIDFSYTDAATLPDTEVNMIKPLDLGNRILKQIGVNGLLTSSVFQNTFGTGYEYLMFTGGKHVRQFPIATPINTSFYDYIQGYAAVLGLIFLYENGVFKLEKYDYRYGQTTPTITISQYSKVEELTDNDAYFNKVLIGYQNNDYSDVNGNVEFNTEFEFSTINKKKNEINKICNYRADSLGYKQMLENGYSTQGTEDVDGENDNYILSSVFLGIQTGPGAESGVINVKKASDIGTVTGMRGVETYYNLELTPKQNLTRHAFLLDTTLYYLTKQAKYIRSKNNIPLVINGLAELDGNYYQNLQPVIKTKPFNWKLETVLTDELLSFLENTPNNLMRFTGLGDVFLKGATVEEHDKTAVLTLKQV